MDSTSMSSTSPNGPALDGSGHPGIPPGLAVPSMSLRDFFAAMAMNGMIGRTGTYQFSDHYRVQDDAQKCYAIADAMLDARKEE